MTTGGEQPEDLGIGVADEGGARVVVLTGELDLAGEDALQDALREAERDAPELLVVDMSALDFVDSTGSRMLIEAHRRAQEAGRRLVVVTGRGAAHLLLTRSGLDRYLTLVVARDDVDEAVAPPGEGAA